MGESGGPVVSCVLGFPAPHWGCLYGLRWMGVQMPALLPSSCDSGWGSPLPGSAWVPIWGRGLR